MHLISYYEMNNCDADKARTETLKECNSYIDRYNMDSHDWWRVFTYYAKIADLAKEFASASQKPKEEKLQITMGEKKYPNSFEVIMEHIQLDMAADELSLS